MYQDEYDPADWWKDDNEGLDEDYEAYEAHEAAPAVQLTEKEKKIARYEKRAREHWASWKAYGSKTYLYHYKQCNIKIRKLKGALNG